MPQVINSKSESGNGIVYLVRYDETLWLSYSKDDQDFCFREWVKKAQPMGCKFVALQVVPDEFFPLHGHEFPYIARQEPVPPRDGDAFKVKTRAYVEINKAVWDDPATDKAKVRARALEAGIKSGADWYYVMLGNVNLASGANKLGD